MTPPPISPAAVLAGAFRRDFEALLELEQSDPGTADQVKASIANQLRSLERRESVLVREHLDAAVAERDQYRRDFAAMSDRSMELACEVGDLQAGLATRDAVIATLQNHIADLKRQIILVAEVSK